MIRQAVILAAGLGSRLRESDDDLPKPLHQVAGQTLLKRTIVTLRAAGVERVFIVCGFMADALRAAVDGDADCGDVSWIHNADYELSNGVSVLLAAGHVDGAFLLSMADHVYDAALPAAAAAADMTAADLYLCVDRRVHDVYDIDDATKVRTDGDGRIVEIGKTLPSYDAIDCGVFAIGPALFDCLREVFDARGDCSLSEGVHRLSERGRARTVDIGEAFWQDVDTPHARERAERILRG